MSLEERIALLEKNMEVQIDSKVTKLVEEKTRVIRDELRNEFKIKLEIIYKDFELKLAKAQSEQTQKNIKESRSLRQLNLKNIVGGSSPIKSPTKKPEGSDSKSRPPEQIIQVGEYRKRKEPVKQEWNSRHQVTNFTKETINKHQDTLMTKRTEINLSTSIDSRKKSLPNSLLRGKYDTGAKIIRKGQRPSTTKNSDFQVNKTFGPKGSGAMLGTSFTGRKDFVEKSPMEDFTDEIYLNEDPILVSMNQRMDDGGYAQAVLKNLPRLPKFFYPCILRGEGLLVKTDLMSSLDVAKSFVSNTGSNTDSKVQPKFATPKRAGTQEKRIMRGGKKKEAPGNTKILDLENQDYTERWKDIKPEGPDVGDRRKSNSRQTMLI